MLFLITADAGGQGRAVQGSASGRIGFEPEARRCTVRKQQKKDAPDCSGAPCRQDSAV
jgi:hypothetical protein